MTHTRSVVAVCVLAATMQGAALPAVAQTLAPAAAPAAPAAPAGSPFTRLFRDAGRDFTRMASPETAAILGFGAVAALGGSHFDQPVSRSMSSSRALDPLEPGQLIGGAAFQMGGALLTASIGRAAGSARVTTIGADLVRGQIVSQTLIFGAKIAVRRTRPDGTRFSFPSGHSASAFTTATVLQRHLGWKAGVPAYGVAAYVAASRIHARRHFLSDVTLGAAVGIVAGRAVTIGRGDRRFAVVPSPQPGGASVSLTWLGAR